MIMDPSSAGPARPERFVEAVSSTPVGGLAAAGRVFRGQDNIDWPLRPKAGRDEFYPQATSFWVQRGQSSSDLGRFNHWREEAVLILMRCRKMILGV